MFRSRLQAFPRLLIVLNGIETEKVVYFFQTIVLLIVLNGIETAQRSASLIVYPLLIVLNGIETYFTTP